MVSEAACYRGGPGFVSIILLVMYLHCHHFVIDFTNPYKMAKHLHILNSLIHFFLH